MSDAPPVPNEVARFDTSGGGAIVATIADFKGRTVADFRKYYLRNGDTLAPTGKGIAVSLDRLPGLAQLVCDALRSAQSRGLISSNDNGEQS
jgi:hypothetical protein